MAVTSSGTAKVTLPTDEQILITREFDAPRHLVFEAFTTPELVKRWWNAKRGEVTVAEIELRVGGKWRYVMVADGAEVGFHGEYREIVPNERIVSTEFYEGMPEGVSEDDATTMNTATFTETDGRTTLTILVQAPEQDHPGCDHRVRDGGRDAGRHGSPGGGRGLSSLSGRAGRVTGTTLPVARLPAVLSDVSEDGVERPRDAIEIERVHEQRRVADLPVPHEAPELLLARERSLGELLLEGAERPELALRLDQVLDDVGAERADELVLQVRHAHEEAECLHVGASEISAEAGALERTLEVALLRFVAEAREPDAETRATEPIESSSDGLRAPDGDDGDALCLKVSVTSPRESLEREPVADAFDEDDRLRAMRRRRAHPAATRMRAATLFQLQRSTAARRAAVRIASRSDGPSARIPASRSCSAAASSFGKRTRSRRAGG